MRVIFYLVMKRQEKKNMAYVKEQTNKMQIRRAKIN